MTVRGLSSYRYFKRQRVLTLAVVILVASFLFSLTASALLGFYRGLAAYLGEGEDIVAVYDRRSRTPFTGLVPAYLADRLAAAEGVVASSPEVIAPCVVKGQPVFVRGVILERLVELNPLAVEGASASLEGAGSAIVGRSLAERLGLKPGDRVLVLGVLADRYLELQVEGLFVSGSALDDEILVPLYVGQWLRGVDYGSVTLIRLKLDRGVVTPAEIFEVVAAEASRPSGAGGGRGEAEAPRYAPRWVARSFSLEDVGVEEASTLMKSYMERYGVREEVLLAISLTVFLFSSSVVVLASKTVVAQHRSEVEVLRALGAAKRLLKVDMLLKLLPWGAAFSLAGWLAASTVLLTVQRRGYLQVLSHTVPFQLDFLVLALSLFLSTALLSLGVLESEVG